MQFGTHFEIYEQHCALEKINLTNLNRAMLNSDFMAYLKVRTPTVTELSGTLAIDNSTIRNIYLVLHAIQSWKKRWCSLYIRCLCNVGMG